MRVTSEMLARYERECEKRDAEKQMEAGVHTAASATPITVVTQSPSNTMPPDDSAAVDNEKHAAVDNDVDETTDETMDDGILEELTIPGIVINIGEINFGEANINIHNAEHYESSTWMRDGSCGDDSDDGCSDGNDSDDDGEPDDDGKDGREEQEDSKTSAILSTDHHSVEVDQADMKDAISHILKIDRSTVEKVFLGMRLYLDALAEVLDEIGEPADEPGDHRADSHAEGDGTDSHSADDHSADSHRCKGCRIVRSTPESRDAAHLV